MTKNLYLARHGQTLFNLHHKTQGWSDSPLTELGVKLAKKTGQHFKENGVHFDLGYSSTSGRANRTLELMTDEELKYERLPELREQNYGVYEAQDSYLRPHDVTEVTDAYYERQGVEKPDHVQNRIVHCIKKIMDEAPEGSNVLIVGHGFSSFTFDVWAAGLGIASPREIKDELMYQKIRDLFIPNAGYVKIEYNDGNFKVLESYNPATDETRDLRNFLS